MIKVILSVKAKLSLNLLSQLQKRTSEISKPELKYIILKHFEIGV